MSLSADYIVRSFRNEDIDETVLLLTTCLGKTDIPRTREFWEWKHSQNPFGSSPAVVALSEGKIIGLRVFMRWSWMTKQREARALRAVDTVTHPDFRGKGVFAKLTSTLLEEMTREGAAFVFNTPNKSSLPGYHKMGWSIVTRLPLWLRPLNPLNIAWKQLSRKTKETIGQPAADRDERLQLSPEIVDQVLDKQLPEARYHTKRSYEYLTWRYCQIPGFSYKARWTAKNGGTALIIYRIRLRKRLSELSVSEILLSPNPESIPVGSALLSQIAREYHADYLVSVAAKNTPEAAVLKNSGCFLLPNRGPVLTAKPLAEPGSSVFDWANWRCSTGDLELF